MMRRFWLESYGCQMNMAESNAIQTRLEAAGLSPADGLEDADIAIINTCSVRKSAEDRIYGRLGYFEHVKKQNRNLKIVVTGCMAQRLLDELKKECPQVDYVVPVNDKGRIVDIATGGELEHSETYHFDLLSYQEGEISSFVPIMNGCNNFCTYCIVPYVRGREVSRPVEEILEEIRFLDGKGVREITLLGQNVNSYVDGDVRFPQLLGMIARECHAIRWIRFDSPHPKDFSDELIQVIATEPKVAKHIHIPLQSGSSKVLRLMNRHYTKEQFLDLIAKMRSSIPGVTFAVDVMVGFPQETEEDFHETLGVLSQMRATEPFMYYYNEREGTRAVSMDGKIDEETKGRRLSELIAFQTEIVREEKKKRVGSVAEVLVGQVSKQDQGMMLCHSEHNEMVVVPTTAPVGTLLTVRLSGLKGNTFTGEEVQNG